MKKVSSALRIEVGRLLLWLADDIQHEINKDLATQNLSLSKISILWLFAHNNFPEQKFQPSDLSNMLEVSRAFVSKELKHLEAKGFITRNFLENDKRAVYINVTPAGKEFIVKILPRVEEACEKLMDIYTDAEIELIMSLLMKLNKKFENHFIN